MIEGVTLTTTTNYVKNHEDEARALILALIDGIHFFKTKKADTLAIVKKHCSQLLKMHDDEEWNCFYDTQSESLEKAPYPSLEAIQNVFALGVKRDPQIKEFNPLALWDLCNRETTRRGRPSQGRPEEPVPRTPAPSSSAATSHSAPWP